MISPPREKKIAGCAYAQPEKAVVKGKYNRRAKSTCPRGQVEMVTCTQSAKKKKSGVPFGTPEQADSPRVSGTVKFLNVCFVFRGRLPARVGNREGPREVSGNVSQSLRKFHKKFTKSREGGIFKSLLFCYNVSKQTKTTC